MRKLRLTEDRKTGPAVLGLILVLVVAAGSRSVAQQELTGNVVEDPHKATFIYQDIENFLRVIESIVAGMDSREALQSLYLDAASPGLRMFIQKYDLSVERIEGAMEKHPEAYARLADNLETLKAREPSFREAYAAIKSMIPNAVFPPTYFLVAGHRGIGSGSTEGPLISVEKKTPGSIQEGLAATLVHEMIHMEQLAAVGEEYFAIFSGPERTLLATSIREGAATFMAEMIAGGSKHKNLARDYYLEREAELWSAFEKEMLGQEMGDWLWKKPANPQQPQDLGYAIGARIVEAYYRQAEDKRVAAQEIMAITDYPAFLRSSGYADKVRQRFAPKPHNSSFTRDSSRSRLNCLRRLASFALALAVVAVNGHGDALLSKFG